MSVALPGAIFLSTFLMVALGAFSMLLGTGVDQTDSLRQASELRAERLRTLVSITSTGTSTCGYLLDVLNRSDGISFGDFGQMDLFALYTTSSGTLISDRLSYPSQWGVFQITGDTTNPGVWDPGETATISFNLLPQPGLGTKGTVVVAVPSGVYDSGYFDAGNVATCFYLHNDPTPPVGDTLSHAVLPITGMEPRGSNLYNYDTDRDAAAGLVIQKGGKNVNEADPLKYQVFRTETLAGDLVINGNVTIEFWAAIKDFADTPAGKVTFFIRDRDETGGYTEIADGTRFKPTWDLDGTGSFTEESITISSVSYTVPAGHELEIKIIVESAAGDDMWFAYDTSSYPSRIVLP